MNHSVPVHAADVIPEDWVSSAVLAAPNRDNLVQANKQGLVPRARCNDEASDELTDGKHFPMLDALILLDETPAIGRLKRRINSRPPLAGIVMANQAHSRRVDPSCAEYVVECDQER